MYMKVIPRSGRDHTLFKIGEVSHLCLQYIVMTLEDLKIEFSSCAPLKDDIELYRIRHIYSIRTEFHLHTPLVEERRNDCCDPISNNDNSLYLL